MRKTNSPKVVIAGRIQAEHRMAQEFNKQLEYMVQRRADVVAELAREAELVRRCMRREYVYEVRDASSEPFIPPQVRDAQPIRLVRRWTNKELWAHHARTYGVSGLRVDDPEVVVSRIYYWQNGMIVSWTGAGATMLKVNVQCTEEQWVALRRGAVQDMLDDKSAA